MASLVQLKVRSKQRSDIAPTGIGSVRSVSEATRPCQVIEQEQSAETVQILLLGSLSCLSYIRGFFPEYCFDAQYYDTNHKHQPYRDFADGVVGDDDLKNGSKNDMGRRKTTSLRVLRKNRHDGADKLLHWLEKGVFDALQMRVLRGLQLSVFANHDNPSNVIEAYTFTINYLPSASDETLIAGIEMQGPRGQPVTIKNAKTGLQRFVRQLITLCGTLPNLPSRRFLTMHLFYTEGCDPDYEPPGFVRSLNPTVRFPSGDSWKMELTSCGIMDAGFYSISLNVNHLVRTRDPNRMEDSLADNVKERLPTNLDYSVELLREDALGKSISAHTETAKAVSTQSTSQNAKDHETKQYFRRLLEAQPKQLPHSLDDTQCLDDAPFQSGLLTKHNQRIACCELSPEKLGTLQSRQKQCASLHLNDSATQEGEPISQLGLQEDVPECQCGYNQEEGEMIHCRFCDRWQHLHCYGFLGSADQRIPNIHACYRCLLEDKEAPLLRELKDVALLRRALFIAGKSGYMNDRSFSQVLQCDLQTTSRVVKYLRKEGYLVDTPGSHSRGFASSGKPKMKVTEKEPGKTRMLEQYFDPLAKIAHHYTAEQQRDLVDSVEPYEKSPLAPSEGVSMSASAHRERARDLSVNIEDLPTNADAAAEVEAGREISARRSRLVSATNEPGSLARKPTRYQGSTCHLQATVVERPSPRLDILPVRSMKRTLRTPETLFQTPSRKRMKASTTNLLIDVGSVSPSSVGETQDEL